MTLLRIYIFLYYRKYGYMLRIKKGHLQVVYYIDPFCSRVVCKIYGGYKILETKRLSWREFYRRYIILRKNGWKMS